MSRSIKGGKPSGYEYWSKRPGRGEYGGNGGSSFGKRLTHKAERRERKEIAQNGLREAKEGAKVD